MPRKNAFTLVELLVVVAIMGVLLGILLPALSRAREQARNMVCQSNLKGYGRVMSMYLSDNGECFPNSYNWLYTSSYEHLYKSGTLPLSYWRYPRPKSLRPDSCRWHRKNTNLEVFPEEAGVLYMYMKDTDYHVCPTFESLAVSGLGKFHYRHKPKIPIEPQYTYSINGYLGPSNIYYPVGEEVDEYISDLLDGNYRFLPVLYPVREGYGVVRKLGQLERNPSRVFSFAEENIMWDVPGRSAVNVALGNNNIMVSRITEKQTLWEKTEYAKTGSDVIFTYSADGRKLLPRNYKSAFATYHLAPSNDIGIEFPEGNENDPVLAPSDPLDPEGDLGKGKGNAVFLDGHVESIPWWEDTHEYSWPLRNRILRPWSWPH
ncbi:type II secretion system protein [Planctomycetota bacterium]